MQLQYTFEAYSKATLTYFILYLEVICNATFVKMHANIASVFTQDNNIAGYLNKFPSH